MSLVAQRQTKLMTVAEKRGVLRVTQSNRTVSLGAVLGDIAFLLTVALALPEPGGHSRCER